jgi:hypothetical protein
MAAKYVPKVEAYVELGSLPMGEAFELTQTLRVMVREFDVPECVEAFAASLEAAYAAHEDVAELNPLVEQTEDDGEAVA